MTPTEFELAVADALRATRDRPEARLVLDAAGDQVPADLDGFDTIALIAGWVTAALDPAGGPAQGVGELLGMPGRGFPVFRLPGIETAITLREARQ